MQISKSKRIMSNRYIKHRSKYVKASFDDELDYVTVVVNFAGMVGMDEEYEILASPSESDETIIDQAREEALADLDAEIVEPGEVCVTFAGYVGSEEYYNVDPDLSEDEQIEAALDEAYWDLDVEIMER